MSEGSRRRTDGLRPEDELLIHCMRVDLEQRTLRRIAELCREPMAWDDVIQMALRHGVAPLLYRGLHRSAAAAVPTSVLDRLRERARATALRNLRLTGELFEVLEFLESSDIAAIPFKGPVLAAAVYGDLALRQFGDLDLLVPEQDAPRARDLLLSRGYVLCPALEAQGRAVHRLAGREYRLSRDGGQVIVELAWRVPAHWQMPNSWSLDHAGLWIRQRPTSVAGRAVPSLSPEDLLLVLCTHGTCHHWGRLLWICDVAELIRTHGSLDWSWVLAQAASTGCERMLLLGVSLAADLLAAPLPEHVARRLDGEWEVRALADQVRRWLFCQEGTRLLLWEESAFFVRSRERRLDRWPYWPLYLRAYVCAVLTPTEKDRAFLALPRSLGFLYYLVRPIRLARDHGPRLLRKVFGRTSGAGDLASGR